jgi:hypothetical protein
MPSGILLPVKGMLETLENSSIGMLDYLMLVVIQTMKLHGCFTFVMTNCPLLYALWCFLIRRDN